MNHLIYGSVMVSETEKGSSCNTKVQRLKNEWLKLHKQKRIRITVSLLLLPYKMCITSHPQAERASNRAVHSSLQNGESYHRTCFISPPRIWRLLQNFWKMCGPLT